VSCTSRRRGDLLFFLLGLFLGSFLNVVAERAVRGESWALSRSKCDSCGHVLAWYDLIPVLSWLACGGRCRYCGKPVSVRYPLSELAFGAAVFFSARWYPPAYTAYIVAGLCVLYLSVLTDIYDGTIHDMFTIPFAGAFLLAGLLLFSFDFFLLSLFGGLAGFLVAILLSCTGKMGQGDATLLLFAGTWLGLWDLVRAGVFAALISGAVIVFLLASGRITLKSRLPLAPFLFAGVVLNFYL